MRNLAGEVREEEGKQTCVAALDYIFLRHNEQEVQQ